MRHSKRFIVKSDPKEAPDLSRGFFHDHTQPLVWKNLVQLFITTTLQKVALPKSLKEIDLSIGNKEEVVSEIVQQQVQKQIPRNDPIATVWDDLPSSNRQGEILIPFGDLQEKLNIPENDALYLLVIKCRSRPLASEDFRDRRSFRSDQAQSASQIEAKMQ